jgi:flagellar biosynthesis protein FlhA
VIEAFGQFVVGGNYVVGFVLFLALIAIQFLVVSHGAVRTAEVTARFTLDALPGKQMAIDADMNAGLIDESEARGAARRLPARPSSTGRWTARRASTSGIRWPRF